MTAPPKLISIFKKDSKYIKDARINHGRILKICYTENGGNKLLTACGVLPSVAQCKGCGEKLDFKHALNHKDELKFARCTHKTCGRGKIGLRAGTILVNSSLSTTTFFTLVYGFLEGWKYCQGEFWGRNVGGLNKGVTWSSNIGFLLVVVILDHVSVRKCNKYRA